jgi:hypothetical protein
VGKAFATVADGYLLGRVTLNRTQRAKDLRVVLADGQVGGFSFKYSAEVTRPGWVDGKSVRELLDVELYSIDLVDEPMHRGAKLGLPGDMPRQRAIDLLTTAEFKSLRRPTPEQSLACVQAEQRLLSTNMHYQLQAVGSDWQELERLAEETKALQAADPHYRAGQAELRTEWVRERLKRMASGPERREFVRHMKSELARDKARLARRGG